MEYLLFAGHHYYPHGGIDDLQARGDIEYLKAYFLEHAAEIANESYIDNWGQIVDAITLRCVLVGEVEHVGDYMTAGVAHWSTPTSEGGGHG